ncbi:hypothetical protein PG984_007213 [Apiospora sp. TS-2023a]
MDDAAIKGLARLPGSKYLRKAFEIAKGLGNKTWHPVPEPKPLVAKRPSWWFNRQYNTVICLLYQLPDELLLEICRNLEGSDVYIARQTCFSFRRVLDDEEFLKPALWRLGSPLRPAPKLGVDWDDVFERLRRRGCCSACIDARIPKQDGGESDFDSTMLRMANETQYCTACKDWHPWIMFSHRQRKSASSLPPSWPRGRSSRRNRKKGAVCIMAEGSVRICPHHSVNLRVLRDRRDEILPHVDGGIGKPAEPLTLNCEDCFQEMEEPLRSAALRPTATFRATRRDIDGVIGKAYVCWSLPLKVGIDTVLEGDWKALQKRAAAGDDERRSSEAEELEGALAKAAETYNDLLCPHARFDDGHTLQDFASHAEEIMYDFRKGYSWIVRLGKNGFYHQNEAGDTRLTDERNICKVCSRWLRPRYGRKLEYIWTLGEKHGLLLHRQLELPVPAFDSQFQVDNNVWRQLMSPESYGLHEDTELRHITWCPDNQCANGKDKGWVAHRQYLDVVAEHFRMRAGFPSYRLPRVRYPPVHRKIDDDFMRRHDNASKATRAPHVYRGLSFHPIEIGKDPFRRRDEFVRCTSQ